MAGAAGYILKQVGGNDFVETVRRVAAGQSMLDPAVTAQVLERVRQRAQGRSRPSSSSPTRSYASSS